MRHSDVTQGTERSRSQTTKAEDLAWTAAQRFLLQPLEDRLLFSANTGTATDNTIGADAVKAINDGLADVVKFAAELDQFGDLDASIAGVGKSLGDLFDLGSADGKGGFLGSEIAQPLDQFLKSGGLKASEVKTFLAGLTVGKNSVFDSISVESVIGGYYADTNEYEWELTVKGVRTTSFALDPGSDLGTEGLGFDGAVNLEISADVALTFSFGAKADGTGFFVTFSNLDLGASLDTGKTLTFGVDFAAGGSLGVKDGQVKIDARVSDISLNVTKGANGRIGSTGLAQLKDGLTASEITYTEASASLHAELPLDAIATGFPTIFIDSDDVFSGTAPDVSVKYFLTDATLQTQILDLLGAMDSAVSGITSSELLNGKIPVINKSISELLPDADFETFLSFKDVAGDYFKSTAAPELPGLVAALTDHFGELTSLASAGIDGAFDALSKQIEFGINLKASPNLEIDVPLDRFGDAAVEMGLKVPDTLKVNVTGTAIADFVLGVDLTDLTLTADDFYLKINELSASAGVTATGLDFTMNIGPLEAGVKGGTIDLSAKASVGFTDPNNDGRISISEISPGGVSITPSGNVDVKLPLVMAFGGYDFKVGAQSPYIRFFSSNPLTERLKVDATTPNFSRLFNLGKMGPEQVLDLMIAAGDFAEQFRDAAVFDIEIPFLDNVDLGDAFDFGLLFAKNLRDRLSINEVSVFSGLTSLNLSADTPFVISIDGDSANSKRVVLPKGDYASVKALAAGLNTAIKAVYGDTPPVTAVVDNGGDRKAGTADDRVKLISDPDAVSSFGIVGTLAGLEDLGFYTGATAAKLTTTNGANANGKLTANATFSVSIDGAAPITVNVTKTATDANTSVADLAADVDAALKAAGVNSITVTENGGKLVFTGNSSIEAFVIAGVGETAWNQLGLENSNVAGMSSVGSVKKTGPAFSTFQELVPLIAQALGIPENIISPSYDPNTETIKLHVEFGYNPDPIKVPVSFDLNLGDLAGVSTVDADGNQAPAFITLTPKLNAKLDFGYSFRPTIADEELSVAPAIGYVSPAGYDPDATTLTPLVWNGRLGSDSHFTVILDDAVSRSLTIPAANTSTNTSVADLVADINAAIASAAGLNGKIQAKVIAAEGETAARVQIVTVAGASKSLQVKTTASDSAFTELGFATDNFAMGSNQTISVAGLADKKAAYVPGADATFHVSIDGGVTTPIVVKKAATDDNKSFGDLLLDINAAIKTAGLDSKLVATRFGAGDRIQFSTVGAVRTLRLDAESNDAAVTKLGFSADEIFLRQRGGGFFIENAEIAATARLAVEDLRLAAQIGFIGINTGDSGGEINLGLSVALKDSSNNTRFGIGDLFSSLAKGGIGSIAKVTPTGDANFSLTDITVSAGLFTLPGSPTIGFVISDLFASPFTVTPVFENMPSLTNFTKLDFATIFNAVKQGVEVLSNYEQFGFLNNKIPVINLSAVEILDYADQLRQAVEELQENPAGALQFVESKIEEFFGLPANFVNLSVEGPNLDVVKISFTLEKTYANSFTLDLDLADLGSLFSGGLPAGLQTISSLIDASAEGDLEIAAFAEAKLELGIDLSAPTSPKTFLYDTSGLTFGIRLAGQNLNFNANIGMVGLAVTGGTVLLDSDGKFDVFDQHGNPVQGGDGVIDDDFATIRIGLKDNAEPGSPNDGRHYFTESFTFADDFEVTFQGQFVAELPVVMITPIGNIDLDQAITLTTSAADFPALIQRTAGAFPIKITAPNIKDLLPEVPGIIQLLRDPSILLDGVDSALFKIQSALDSQTSQKLPLLGDRLAEGAQVIEDFREGFLAALTEKLRGAGDNLLNELRGAMFSFFDGTLGLLQDYNGDGDVTIDDIVLTFRKADGSLWEEGVDAPKDQDAVQFGFHLGDEYIADIPDLAIDFSLPGLALDINGSPSVGLSWDMYFGFGVSVSDLFFIDAQPTTDGLPKHDGNEYVENELEVNFDVLLTSDPANPFTATGQLFFLQLQAKDTKLNADNTDPSGDGGKFSYFNGKFAVNISDPGIGAAQDGRLTFPEIFKKSKDPVIKASLSAVADINLRLDLSVQGSKVLPRILADFNLDWSWAFGSGAQAPKVGFNNVKLDLGSFISDFLGPIAQKINDAIKPFDPVLDALQTRIPVLSDLMGRDYTILDLAATFGKVDRRFVDAVLQVRGLIADIAAAAASGETILIDIGSIIDFGNAVTKKGAMKSVDPASMGISTKNISVPDGANAQTKSVMSKSTSVTGGGFAFPILKPSNVFKLLMGQDATLFTYDIPRLEVGMSMSARFSIFGPLVATFGGKISAFADLAVGFDTKGLNQFKTSGDPLDILDGFYVSDRANPDGTGADVPEAGFSGRIEIGGAVNLAVVEAGISGFFQITANLDLNDPNDDGKIRGSEIISLLKYKAPDGNYYGPLNLGSITLKGEVGARAYVDVWAPFDWYNVWEYEFFRTTLFEKTFSAPRPQPELAKVSSGGVLSLNAGTGAGGRVFGSTTDVGEDFTLVSLPDGRVQLTFNNTETTQIYSGVTSVEINAGKGNDRIDASKLNVPVKLWGGEGDDVLIAGSAGGYLDGGDGNDELIGGNGVDILVGGKGADLLEGGNGDDILDGGEGRDQIKGGFGRDTYKFSNNWGADVLELVGDADPANLDTLDFSGATDALNISIGSQLSKITAGKNSLTAQDSVGEIQLIKGGSGGDTVNINASTPAGITIDGGKGSDTYLIGFGRLVGTVNILDTQGSVGDSDTVVAIPLASDPIGVFDNKLTSTTSKTVEQVTFDGGIENLTIDATKNVVTVNETLDFNGDVRMKALTALIPHAVSASYIRVDSINSVEIAADLNSRRNGNLEVVVAKGDIQINSNVLSSSGTGASGDGSGVVQLISRGGQITADGTGVVRAANGYLLLLGTTGSIGTVESPVLTQIKTLAANTTGDGMVNIREEDGMVVEEVAIIKGIKSNGGEITITNLTNELRFQQSANAKGGDMTFTTDQIQINADLISPSGDLQLQPVKATTSICLGDGISAIFNMDTSEISHIVDGFNTVTIGRDDGSHPIYIEDVTFQDPTFLQNPILGGRIYQTGQISSNSSVTVIGSGHTIELDTQDVSSGNINILDSAIVRQGESVRLEADSGNININFDVDGTVGGAGETLTLNAPNGIIVIKGNIGSLAKLENLIIENATAVYFEGSVNVGTLTIQNAGTVRIDGAVTADTVSLETAGYVDFRSSVSANVVQTQNGTVGTAVFQGAISASSVNVSATTLLDFYQGVNTTGNVSATTTGLMGDIVFRQQVNAGGAITVGSLDDITFSGPVTAANVTVTSANDLAFQSSTTISGVLEQLDGTGLTTFGQVQAGSIELHTTNLTFTSTATATTGGISIEAAPNGTILASGTITANSGPLTISQTGSVTFSARVNVQSASVTAAQFITVATTAAFEVTEDLSLTTTDTAVGEIRLTGPLNVGGDVEVNSARAVSFLGAVDVSGDVTITKATSVQYQGTVDVDGTFTQSALVTGATSFTANVKAGSLDLQAGSLTFVGDVTSLGTSTLRANTGAISVTGAFSSVGDLTVSKATTLSFVGAVTASAADLTVNDTIIVGAGGITTSTGDIKFTTLNAGAGNGVTANGVLDASGDLVISTPRGVALNNTVNAADASITAASLSSANQLTFTGAVTISLTGDFIAAADLLVGGALTIPQVRDVSFGGIVSAANINIGSQQARSIIVSAAGLTSTGDVSLTTTNAAVGEIRLTGPLNVGGDVQVSSARAVSFVGAIDVVGDFTITKATSVQYQGTVDVDGALSQTAQVTGAASFAANVEAGSLDLQAGSLVFAGDVTSLGNSVLRANTGAINVTGAFTSTGDLTVSKATVLSFAAAVTASAADLTVNDTITVGAGGITTSTGAIKLTTLIAGLGNSITVNGVVDATGDLVISTPRGVALNSTVDAANATITAASLSSANQLAFTGFASISLTGDFVAAADLSVGGELSISSVRDVSFGGVVTASSVSIGKLAARNITISAAGLTSSGHILLNSTVAGAAINLNGPVTSTSGTLTLTALGNVTAVGAVSATVVSANAATLTFGSNVTSAVGNIELASTGNVSIAGAATAAQELRISQAQDAAIQGAIVARNIKVNAAAFLAGNTVTTLVGNFELNTDGNIRVVGLSTVAESLLITRAANVTFEGQVLVTGVLRQNIGIGTTRFEGVTQAAEIELVVKDQIYAGNIFRALNGDIYLESNEIDFTGGTNTVQGGGKLILRPASVGTTIDVGSPTPGGILDISDVDLTAIRDGFTEIVIGRAQDGTGAMVIGSSVFKDNVSFHAGNITVPANPVVGQQVTSLESIKMISRVGGISINDDVVAADITLNSNSEVTVNHRVEGANFVTVLGTGNGGNITVTSAGELVTTGAGSDISITTNPVQGDVQIAGKIAAIDDVTIVSSNGAITQTAGNTSAVDLYATAKSGITLLTTVDHISARVTGTGDLTITDTNPDLQHFINLGSETDVNDGLFTADGKITVNVNANANALRIQSSKGVFLNIAGDVFVRNVVGSPSVITGTVLLDEDRTTFGEDIVFAGNIRLLRDVTLASNGGNIVITGRVTSTAGEQFGLTLDADGGDVTVGGPIGTGAVGAVPLEYLRVVDANNVTFGTVAENGGAIAVTGNIEVNANAIEFNSAPGSVQTTNGGELILRPLNASGAIDIGGPAGGNAAFSLNDAELRAFGNGFSLITIGQADGTHAVKVESAQFRDSLVVHGATVELLTSATPQGVTGLSVVNGNDDNSITINAVERFTQGSRAAINAGRYGDIVITADQIDLDPNGRNLIRGFGDLVLQPASTTQSITLGTAGSEADFDLTIAELGTFADGFQSITIGRANGEHGITVDANLKFRDAVTIQAPAGAGAITVGTGATAMSIQMIGKGDTLTMSAGANVTLDASLSAVGSGALVLNADADQSGSGDLLIGQNLAGKNRKLTISTQNGDIRLTGENVLVGKVDGKLGAVRLISKLGNVIVAANGNADNNGEIAFTNSKSAIATSGQVTIGITGLTAQNVTVSGIKITAQKGLTLQARANVLLEAGTKVLAKAGSVQLIADRPAGVLQIDSGVSITAKQTVLLSAFTVDRSSGAIIKAPEVTVDQG